MDTVDSTSDDRTVNNTMRHQYRVLGDQEKADMAAIKDKGLEFVNLLHDVAMHRKPSHWTHNLELANDRIQEAVMWAVKHVTE